MTDAQKLRQQKIEAKLRAEMIARKAQAQRLQSSGYVPSQLGFLTSENRLIKNGHYGKTPEQAKTAFKREELRKIKAAIKAEKRRQNGDMHKHIVKRDGKVIEYREVMTNVLA